MNGHLAPQHLARFRRQLEFHLGRCQEDERHLVAHLCSRQFRHYNFFRRCMINTLLCFHVSCSCFLFAFGGRFLCLAFHLSCQFHFDSSRHSTKIIYYRLSCASLCILASCNLPPARCIHPHNRSYGTSVKAPADSFCRCGRAESAGRLSDAQPSRPCRRRLCNTRSSLRLSITQNGISSSSICWPPAGSCGTFTALPSSPNLL